MFGLCFVMFYLVCIAIILTRKRELDCLPVVSLLLVFYGSTSRYRGLVCSS